MKTWVRTFAATTAAVTSVLVAAGAATAQATTIIEFTTAETEVAGDNPCSGEAILLTGEVHGFLRLTQSPSGAITVTVHAEGLLRGFGIPSGQPYLLPIVATQSAELVGQETADTTVITLTSRQQMITAGGHNDLYGQITFHVTIVDGEPTAEVEKVTIGECK